MVPVFPKTIEVPQLQYIYKEVDVAVAGHAGTRSAGSREASTGAVLGQGASAVHRQGG